MVFASAAIVTGVLSYLLNRYRFRGSHIVYEEVIVRTSPIFPPSMNLAANCDTQAVITMVWYLIAMFLPLSSAYGGHFLPVSFIFSYLWLTSFILAVTDWRGNLCRSTSPGFGRCALKRTVEAFTFVAL